MFTISNYNYDCLKNCRSRDHGETIAKNVLHRDNISDEKLAAFIGKTCKNFACAEFKGITALHMLSTKEQRATIVEWLINYGADVNAVSSTTRQAPLHYALASNAIEIAVVLLRYGASLDLIDAFQWRPLNYCGTLNTEKIMFSAYETFVWGSNKNYNLGIANEEDKNYPQPLSYFKENKICLLSASISSYHSMFLDNQGKVYAVGHGKFGQLGTGDTSTLVLPKLIKLPIKKNETVIRISTARQHSLILTSNNLVYACGSNQHGQLGVTTGKGKKTRVLSESKFKEVQPVGTQESGKILGIIARDYFSIAYKRCCIYAWGRNGGQFGVETIDTTAPTKAIYNFFSFESSNAAIVCCTNINCLIIFHKYKIKFVKSPRYESIKAIAVLGGKFCGVDDATSSDETLKIMVCTRSNFLYIWYEDTNQFVRCFTLFNDLNITKLLWPREDNIMFVGNGTLNSGTLSFYDIKLTVSTNSEDFQEIVSAKKDVSTVKGCRISFQRIPVVDRVVDVQCDQLAESFMVLQEHSQRFLKIPKQIDEPLTFKNLMVEASETDSIHDIVFHIEDDIYVAHKLIVFSRANGLRDIVEKQSDKHVYLNYDGLTSKMFELMMKHMYCNYSLNMSDVCDIEMSMGAFSGYTNLDIFDLFQEFAGKFGLANLVYTQR
ncbi:Inhibitor of Bruton tyrosine kinase [Pseudolycoriella hygida]|uniref:Inhibitor of Bruton tyrosine kinase n=1 Tax=Pseudolycoriella hygida TaxID=35572 RepID=A0A9Q0S2G2_9DIPT|nr:Inhibitor of Bruton tyrosine kinase [Pseudolycoriella hygida]